MNIPRDCGCKGCRTCLICEEKYGVTNKETPFDVSKGSYIYCPYCNKAWPGWDINSYKTHPLHEGIPIDYPGVYIKLEFLNEKVESDLISNIDCMPWDLSQSGRRKQNFGPKCNFKKRKLRLGDFNGFPQCTKIVQDKFTEIDVLKGFQTIEQCSLEYDPARGASIDPHIDDCWVWGERIVTVNLLSDTVLTLTGNINTLKYNLDCVKSYPAVLKSDGHLNTSSDTYKLIKMSVDNKWPVVRIPMIRRSLFVMYGSPRYDWEHCILREDIKTRRICLAYREFTPSYLFYGDKYCESKVVLEKAKFFWT